MSLPPIEAIRKEAKRMKKQSNGEYTHAECLDAVAAKYGFRDWPVLKIYHPERSAWRLRQLEVIRSSERAIADWADSKSKGGKG